MKSGLKDDIETMLEPGNRSLNLCRDEKRTESYAGLGLAVLIRRLNLCRDEKRTESFVEVHEAEFPCAVSTYAAMKSGLKGVFR